MPDSINETSTDINEEKSKYQERAHRILNAALELLLRWGYRKTSMEDIAKLAGVAKGTLYLHWKTRDDLFMTLILREGIVAAYKFVDNISHDPEGLTLHTMAKYSIYMALTNPFSKAIYLSDEEILGEIAAKFDKDAHDVYERKFAMIIQVLTLLRNKGLVRSDQQLTDQLHAVNAILFGFLTIDKYLPTSYQLSPAATAEQAAEVVYATFAPPQPANPTAAEEVTAEFVEMYSSYLSLAQAELDRLLRS